MSPVGPAPLIDREPECRALDRLMQADTPKLALLTGRRRVGKTFLLTHAWGERDYFLFTASRVTAEANRLPSASGNKR